jgi:tight adherence protein B
MTAALGLCLGAGVLLVVSPMLWPRRSARRIPNSGWLRLARERLVQAGLERVSPGLVVGVSVVTGATVGAVVVAITSVTTLALAAAVVAALLPSLVVSWRARARRRAVRVVWPDVVDQLVSAVRSGLALPDGVISLGENGPEHTREAFAMFAQDYRTTGNFSTAVDALKERLADPVADRILETLRMSREVGGSELVTVLRNLSASLRQHIAIRSEVEARQSWVVNAARLGVAAPWIVLLLLATRPEAAAAYNSPAGAALIVGGLVVSVVAYRLMIGLGRLPEERRWFA